MPSVRPHVPAVVSRDFFIVTCEHGGNRIPARYRNYFSGHGGFLETHRGYDRGALPMARSLASALSAPLFYTTVSRLLIDLNRSPNHPKLYSELTRPLPRQVKQEIMERHYLPYRTEVESRVAQAVKQGRRVIHISSHSFTPELNGEVRDADIGLLYDSKRSEESKLCRLWQAALKKSLPDLRVRMNYPYSGSSDGLTAALRKRFTPDTYTGVELELNQLHAYTDDRHWRALCTGIIKALSQALA
ncbi:N-formylglutamate amidohydrolase [Oxalobacteraceae bacterium R-40]|uniref:N-formylglutamate amidohydrolase n=1 Tax=Keguizhuia sedimenti TaxID=3064264 RepID=A0ABU1BNI8_9BURK|nr:N-formylglutamate amidohydrolase [Oxalobacteraceae bacterium R-40]